jgi:hypothetical protein
MIKFPKFSGIRCLMMPFVQGDSSSVPDLYLPYKKIIESTFIKKGAKGFLTIDESLAAKDTPHRGARSRHGRALHTEAGLIPGIGLGWGSTGWGSSHKVKLDRDVEVLLANSLDDSCAVWGTTQEETSRDGDIGHLSDEYPYADAKMMKAGEVHKIGILTPHESLPVKADTERQFLRIISSGVHGAESHFTKNPNMT